MADGPTPGVVRCDSCNSFLSSSEPMSPIFTKSPQFNEESVALLTDKARLQVRWDQAMCTELGLPQGYTRVSVLLIRWREDDWNDRTKEEIDDLKSIFMDVFGYRVKVVDLASRCTCIKESCHCTPQDRLDRSVSHFFDKYDGPNNLVIVYYTGHGTYTEVDQCLKLHGKEDEEPRASWNQAEKTFLKHARGDILAIMDACFAGNVKAEVGGDYGRTYEFLGACRDTVTAAPGPKSFTRALIASLRSLLEKDNRQAFTTADLYLAVEQNELRKHNPPILRARASGNNRSILLAPRWNANERYFDNADNSEVRAYLNLRVELKEDQLDEIDVEDLAQQVSKALKSSKVKTRRIDWLNFSLRERPTLRQAAWRAHFMNKASRLLMAAGRKPLAPVPEERVDQAPISNPGVFATFGWMSWNHHLHKMTIALQRPWPGLIILGIITFVLAPRFSNRFPILKHLRFGRLRALFQNWLGRANSAG